MADDEDGGLLDLTKMEKIQFGAIGAGTILFLLTYIIQGLLNGFTYVNTWIMSNPVPVAAYWIILIGFYPFYDDIDIPRVKHYKQAIYLIISSALPLFAIWIYYQFNPPTTGVDRIVAAISKYIWIGVLLNAMISKGFHELKARGGEKSSTT